jgi:hypothetical protein
MVIDAVVKHTRTQSERSYQRSVSDGKCQGIGTSGLRTTVNKAKVVNGGLRVNRRAGILICWKRHQNRGDADNEDSVTPTFPWSVLLAFVFPTTGLCPWRMYSFQFPPRGDEAARRRDPPSRTSPQG